MYGSTLTFSRPRTLTVDTDPRRRRPRSLRAMVVRGRKSGGLRRSKTSHGWFARSGAPLRAFQVGNRVADPEDEIPRASLARAKLPSSTTVLNTVTPASRRPSRAMDTPENQVHRQGIFCHFGRLIQR